MTLLHRLLLPVCMAAAFSAPAFSQAPAAPDSAPAAAAPAAPVAAPSAGQPVTRGEIPALVKEALMNEPEIIMEVAKRLREKQEADAKKQASEGLKKYKNDLFNNPDSPAIGPKDADVTIVEFFDYHCGYCKHMLPVINDLMKEDKKVRFVFKEFPILSEDSVLAARVALAVNRVAKDKYFDFHQELMKANVKFDEKMLLDTAKKIGVDTAKVKAEMQKPEITAILDKNREIASTLGVSGTPAIIMGDSITPGAVDLETIKKMVAAVRGGKDPHEAVKAADEAAAAEAPKPQ
jgi:protein-disulfide isomerase